MTASLLGFLALAAAVVAMPGADTILVLRTSLRAGARTALVTALGVVCGPVVWGALAGLGVALVLSRLPVVYAVVALAGAGYLAYLAMGGLRAARRAWRARADPTPSPTITGAAPTARGAFLTGLLTNLLNPKIGVFYLAVMPGLFSPGAVTVWLGAALGAIHGVLGLVYLSAVALFADRMRRFLTRPAANAVVELACGVVLLLFAVAVVAETFFG
ncbi:LysE family translocator [Microbacterium sp. SORGH_AS_0888]|uniref:LysE family translocator n=1 Tax=Microbacterium sp. SORGH_AS_0888 TaxID=3041791 RepID=UPI0027D90400|nr:LysE family translocator [Microbacterium sp. SORGH_AS_0888]